MIGLRSALSALGKATALLTAVDVIELGLFVWVTRAESRLFSSRIFSKYLRSSLEDRAGRCPHPH